MWWEFPPLQLTINHLHREAAHSYASMKYLFSQIKLYLNSSHLLSVHQHSDLVHTLFVHPLDCIFIKSPHIISCEWVHSTSSTAPPLLLLPFSTITFNHIPLHPIADPVKLGATFLFVPAEMSPMFPRGCIIPPRIRHTAAGTDTLLFEYVSLSVPLPFPTFCAGHCIVLH